MPRSSKVYVLHCYEMESQEQLLGAWTVKHELMSYLRKLASDTRATLLVTVLDVSRPGSRKEWDASCFFEHKDNQ